MHQLSYKDSNWQQATLLASSSQATLLASGQKVRSTEDVLHSSSQNGIPNKAIFVWLSTEIIKQTAGAACEYFQCPKGNTSVGHTTPLEKQSALNKISAQARQQESDMASPSDGQCQSPA